MSSTSYKTMSLVLVVINQSQNIVLAQDHNFVKLIDIIYTFRLEGYLFATLYLEPWMPRRVHTAEIIVTIGGCYQRGHFTVRPVKLSQVIESIHNDCNGFRDHVYDGFIVHLHWFALSGSPGCRHARFVFQTFPVTGHHLIA